MKCNVGNTDRIFRAVAGLVIIGIGVYEHSWLSAIGLVAIATAAIRFCPAYTVLGISTDK